MGVATTCSPGAIGPACRTIERGSREGEEEAFAAMAVGDFSLALCRATAAGTKELMGQGFDSGPALPQIAARTRNPG